MPKGAGGSSGDACGWRATKRSDWRAGCMR